MSSQPGDLEAITAPVPDRAQRRNWHPLLPVLLIACVFVSAGVGYFVGAWSQGDAPDTTPSTVAAAPREVSHVSLVLGQGASGAAEWDFPVTDPKRFSLTVTANLTPSDADIGFAVRVPSGRSLNVGRTTEVQSCQGGTAHEICRWDLGRLDAEPPGIWSIRLEKWSTAEAQVSTTIAFEDD